MKNIKSNIPKNQGFYNRVSMMLVSSVLGMTCLSSAQAAIALDRTRAIISGNEKSISLNISNENKQLPYLAQGWIENDKGEKITSPFTVLPPVQRIEPGARSQVKIQVLPDVANLPKDRESVFYFNLREIPPKSDKPNTLQIALQTRIKLFYRPDAIVPTREQMANPWQENLTLIKEVDAMPKKDGKTVAGFEPIMIAPKSSQPLRVSASALGNSPVLTYINDYGGRPTLSFNCQANQCQVVTAKK